MRNRRLSPLHLLLPQLCEIKNRCLTQGKQIKVQLGKYFSPPASAFLQSQSTPAVSFTSVLITAPFLPAVIWVRGTHTTETIPYIQIPGLLTGSQSPRGLVALVPCHLSLVKHPLLPRLHQHCPSLASLFPLGPPSGPWKAASPHPALEHQRSASSFSVFPA